MKKKISKHIKWKTHGPWEAIDTNIYAIGISKGEEKKGRRNSWKYNDSVFSQITKW